MKALIRNYGVKSYLDPMITLEKVFHDTTPADLGLALARGDLSALTAARPLLEEAGRMVHDLFVYAYLAKRIALEKCDFRHRELLNLLEDRFLILDRLVHDLGSRLARITKEVPA